MKKKLNVFLLLSLFYCILLVFFLFRENDIKVREIRTIEETIVDKECELLDWEYNIHSIYSNMGFYINKDSPQILCNDLQKKLSSLDNKGIIYVRISNKNCWECISEISNVINKMHKENIIYLLTSPSVEMTEIMRVTLNLKNSIYTMIDTLELPIEKENKPYLFVIGETNIIERVFIPMRGKDKILEKYLSIL